MLLVKKTCDDARFLRLGRKGNGVSTWYVCAFLLPRSLLKPSPLLTMPLFPEYSELTCRKPDNSDATILEKSESESHSVVSDFLQPHGLYSPWNFPGQNTGVGSLSLLQGDLSNPEIEAMSQSSQADSLPAEPPGKPKNIGVGRLDRKSVM